MVNNLEAELKQVEGTAKSEGEKLKRDPSLTGGERAETPEEKKQREEEKRKPKEPPIIQRPPG